MSSPPSEPQGTLAQALAHTSRLLAADPAKGAEQARAILEAVPGQPQARLYLGMAARRMGDAAEAREVLDTVGLGARADDIAKALPYGERRALEIAVALACRPRLLFLDEPTAGLGSDGRARLVELVRRLKGRVTLVVIEHDMEFLFSLADDISVIHWGQVIARGSPAELRANPWVKNSNLGKLA